MKKGFTLFKQIIQVLHSKFKKEGNNPHLREQSSIKANSQLNCPIQLDKIEAYTDVNKTCKSQCFLEIFKVEVTFAKSSIFYPSFEYLFGFIPTYLSNNREK